MADAEKQIPRATYRLQLSKDFGFADVAALAPYLAELGVSHVYTSPYLRARPGSTHGYDIVSHNELNPELGTRQAFDAMVAAFRQHGLGHILDFVPNHMGVGGADNPMWLDVLEWGPDSEYSGWFDIDWDPERRYLHNKLLVPLLGDQYGAVLESGLLVLRFDAEEGSFAVWAYDTHKLPICPLDYQTILGADHPVLERLGDAFGHLSTSRLHIARRAAELRAELAERVAEDAEVTRAVLRRVEAFNGRTGELASWGALDRLIKGQFWRPAHFRVAADDINYRRFFDINDLAAIRMELPEVFDQAHELVLRLLEVGAIDGLRIDHIDGLFDPKAYCLRLREKGPRPFYLVVEKILAPHESLREDWPVEGTTGYEFANLVTGLLVDPAGEDALTRIYCDFTGNREGFEGVVRQAKLHIMENAMASELHVLAREAGRVARSHPNTADFTTNVLHRALTQIVACFPVYRTYVDGSQPTEADRRDIDWAVAQARRADTLVDASVFDFLHKVLTCDLVAQPRSGYSRVAVTRTAMRFQQFSGPVMAKGLEDTAFYRYNRLLALNEVGGAPDRFGVSLPQFHAANLQRAQRTPHALLSTSTHDTKRGEDTRARLAVLSELAEDWGQQVALWSRMLRARHAATTEDIPPDSNDEYAFYQLVVGAWPPELSAEPLDQTTLDAFCARIEGAMLKSMREAKVHTSWATPNTAYEDAVLDFVRYALDGRRTNPFLDGLRSFLEQLAPLGAWNSLVQTVLKLTVPGVPDIYQGAELWDLSLVDPDNRRPVDFASRRELLQRVKGAPDGDHRGPVDGAVKLRMIVDLLQVRRRNPALFERGAYEALAAKGPDAGRICAFMRSTDEVELVVAALLFPTRGMPHPDRDATVLVVPEGKQPDAGWLSLFDGQRCENEPLTAAAIFSRLPVAVLIRETPQPR
jgi:(1->4)-alpha-D-glucan 1-alpha-D-glucosylmutase